MRIITGTARGKKLEILSGEAVRPTTDRVKESIFNILQFQIEGRRILDLFAGSGQVALEALSRGAASAVFVDSSADCIRVIENNVRNTGFQKQAKVIKADFATFLNSAVEKFDIAFLDPPYKTGQLQKALELTSHHMTPAGTIVCEHSYDDELPESVGEFERIKSYKYGKIVLTLYRRAEVYL